MRNAPGTPRPAADPDDQRANIVGVCRPVCVELLQQPSAKVRRRSEKFEVALEDGVTEFGLDLG